MQAARRRQRGHPKNPNPPSCGEGERLHRAPLFLPGSSDTTPAGLGLRLGLEGFLARWCNSARIEMLRLWEQLSQKAACQAVQRQQPIRLRVTRQNIGINTRAGKRGMRSAFSVFTTHDLIVKAIISYY